MNRTDRVPLDRWIERDQPETPEPSDHPARAALVAYCHDHHEEVRGIVYGAAELTCDEMGCRICNGDTDEQTADDWLASDELLPDLTDYGYEDPDDAH